MEEYKFQAQLHGASFEDEKKKKKSDLMKFGDPDSYKHLSKEERAELTRKMKGTHEQFANKIMT